MNLSQKLSELIDTHMSRPGHVPDMPSEADFVMSGLRAATFANMVARRKILSDIAEVLDCKTEDLEFLYADIPAVSPAMTKYEVMVPDFQTRLMAAAG